LLAFAFKINIRMANEFWSHWSWPLVTALVGLYFTYLVFKQYRERKKLHQLAWSVGLFLYALGALIESYSEFSLSWNPLVYRFYYVVAATLVGFLGLGTAYLIFRKKTFGHLFLAYLLILLIPFLYFALTSPLRTESLILGITVGGKAMPGRVRVFSFFYTIPGTILLLGGAVYSVIRFAAKKEYAYRMWANILIAIGTLIIAFAGSLARAGKTVGLYPAEMLGATFLLLGFLKAGTLEKVVKKPDLGKKEGKEGRMKEVEVGKATHYFSHLSVAAIELSGSLRVGDKVHIKGHTTDFVQEVESMQIEHQPVSEAKAGDSIGLKVREKVREGDTVYKVVEE